MKKLSSFAIAFDCLHLEKAAGFPPSLLEIKGLNVGNVLKDGIGVAFRLSGMRTKLTRFWDSVVKATVIGLLLGCLIPEKGLAQGPPPVITVQPSDYNAILGGTVTFTVVAASGTTLSYQWYKDGLLNLDTKLAGATTSTLTINMGLLDGGTYYVEVKNAGGTVTSRHASLNLVLLNSPPTANDNSYTAAEDVPLTISIPGILANDTDTDGNSLTAVLVSTPAHGSLSINPNGGFSYAPNTNFNGSDSFTYNAHDGVVAGNVATVTINVTPVNDVPVANNDSYSTPEDVTLTVPVAGVLSDGSPGAGILANDTDVDGDALTAVIMSGVNHGTLTLNSNGSFTYVPSADYNGPDSFTYRAADGSATGNVATVNINVTPVSNRLRFASQQMTANGFELQVAGNAPAYVILASSNLRDWTPIFTNAAPSGPIVFTDTTAQNFPLRYYRVETR